MSQSFLAFPVSMPAFGEEAFETNSIMSEPCDFIGEDLPHCAIVRPTPRQNASLLAVGHFLTNTGCSQANRRNSLIHYLLKQLHMIGDLKKETDQPLRSGRFCPICTLLIRALRKRSLWG